MSLRRTVKVYFPAVLASVVAKHRARLGIRIRVAARQAGVSASTFHRVEVGHMPDGRTLIRLSIWAGAK